MAITNKGENSITIKMPKGLKVGDVIAFINKKGKPVTKIIKPKELIK